MAKSIKRRQTLNERPDSADNRSSDEPKEISMDLPDVKDIPGQEFVYPPNPQEFADTTISSADEEGRGIEGLDERISLTDQVSNVTREEADLLARSVDSQSGPEDLALERAKLDNVDEDGETLNEESEFSGKDLDVPGSEDDDVNEEIGEEDEENNSYSLGADKDD